MAWAMVAFALTLNPNHTSQAADQVPMTPEQQARLVRRAEIRTEVAQRAIKLDPAEAQRVADTIFLESERAGIDPLFVIALIDAESAFNPEAVSFVIGKDGRPRANAFGLMQIVNSTFKSVSDSKKLMEPVENVRAGIRYLAKLRSIGFKRPETVLLAYNQGPKAALAVYRDKEQAPDEGARFVPKVMGKYKQLLAKHGRNPRDARKHFSVVRA